MKKKYEKLLQIAQGLFLIENIALMFLLSFLFYRKSNKSYLCVATRHLYFYR